MQYCLEISEESYKQEQHREEVLKGRVDYLFRWLTLFISIFNIVVPLIVKEAEVDYKDKVFVGLYIILMLLLVVAMLIIIFLEVPRKVKIYPLGADILKKAKEEPDKYTNEIEYRYQKILYRDAATRKIQQNNDNIANLLKVVNLILAVAIIGMAVFFVYIVLAM